MVIFITLALNITLGSDVVSIILKVLATSNASSSIIEMFTHLVAPSADPEVKIMAEETMLYSEPANAT